MLFGLAMRRVLAAEPAVLFEFQARRCVLFVFLRRVIAAFTFVARQRYYETIFFLCHSNPSTNSSQKPQVQLQIGF
jgi:hypothetical protein